MKRNSIPERYLKRKFCVSIAIAVVTITLLSGVQDIHSAGMQQKTDTSIRSSVISTLESNPRLAELQRNREAVAKDLEQVKGRYYPRIDLSAGYGTDSHSDLGTRSRGEENDFDSRTEASLSLVQPLYQGGETRGLVEKQTAKLESANFRVYDNAESLALDAIIAHIEVWRQRRLLDLTEQNIRTHERILDHIDERQRAGAGSSADVMQTKGRLALTRSSRAQIVGELNRARVNYLRVVGRSPKKLQLPATFQLLAPASAEAAIEMAQGCNPKLAAFSADIRAARSEISVQKSNFLPKVNLELSTTYEDQAESSTSYTHNNAAMIRARWNLFNGGSDKAARDAASSRKLQLVASRQDQYQKIEEQIRDTWSQFRISGQRTQIFSDAVTYNTQTRDAYQQQFVVGQRSLLDVLDSENELFQSSGQLITARANEIVAVYRLLALSGCLLSRLAVDPEAFGMERVSNDCCGKIQLIDSDGDGVLDDKDRCPDTSPGEAVDGSGCPKAKPVATKSAQVTESGSWIYREIKFETGKWELKPGSYAVLEEIAGWLQSHPELVVEIQGHTDNTGSRDYNIVLSQKRAQTVADYLKHRGIDAVRMTPQGYGSNQPIADNGTAQGRSRNRRVEIKPIRW
jgi:adhesin transport system outer membrane protein